MGSNNFPIRPPARSLRPSLMNCPLSGLARQDHAIMTDWLKNIYIRGGFHHNLSKIGGSSMPAKINKDECVACGACVDVCPEGAITCEDVAVVDEKKCLDCGACVDECPNNSITLEEKK